jgi:hypothetical protein
MGQQTFDDLQVVALAVDVEIAYPLVPPFRISDHAVEGFPPQTCFVDQ